MYFRLPLLTLALATALCAQEKAAPPDAKTQQPAAAQKADPPAADKPREQTPAEQKAKLEAEIERLQKEIAFVKARKGTIKPSIVEKLTQQGSTFEPHKINAGTSRAAMPPAGAAAPRKAKVAEGPDATALGEGVLFTVNGRPVKQAEVDQLVEYLKTVPMPEGAQLPETFNHERAVRELIQVEAAHATFAKDAEAAAAKAKELEQKLQKGADFAEVAKDSPVIAGDKPGAVFSVTRNSPHGLSLERMAFTTKPGSLTPVFRTPLGYTILRVEKFEKGEKPIMDHADVRALVVPYGPSIDDVRKVLSITGTGQIDIVLKDEKTRQLLPMQFR